MDGWFAAGELHDLGSTFGSNKVVQHLFDFFHGQTEARAGFRKTQRAIHIANAIHFDDAQTSVLLVVGAQAAIVRTSVLYLAASLQRNGSRLVVPAQGCVSFRVSVNKSLERSALRAALAHEDFVIAQDDLRVDNLAAFRTDAARQFVKDVIGVLLRSWCGVSACGEINLRWVSHGRRLLIRYYLR